MRLNRRELLTMAAAGAATSLVPSNTLARAETSRRIKAVAFDGFAIFDPRSVFGLAEQLFPGKGTELGNAWRTRQFEYAWLRTLTGRYADFWQVTDDALVFSARLLKLDLRRSEREKLMQAYLEIKAWPDVPPALKLLKDAGVRMAILSNFTAPMLDRAVKNSGLENIFEPHLSTDRVSAYKPDPRAYQMGVDAFGLSRQEIAFVAFGGWDAAGARSYGYPTFWVNRMSLPEEELGAGPDAIGGNLDHLVEFVIQAR